VLYHHWDGQATDHHQCPMTDPLGCQHPIVHFWIGHLHLLGILFWSSESVLSLSAFASCRQGYPHLLKPATMMNN
jgi:hypothetical protein